MVEFIGLSTDIDKRFKEYNARKTKSIKSYLPCKLVHYEEPCSTMSVREKEKYLNFGIGKEFLKSL